MNKSLIGLIITIIGFIIFVSTGYIFQTTSIFDTDAMNVCYIMVLISGTLMMVGIFIMAERLKQWIRR